MINESWARRRCRSLAGRLIACNPWSVVGLIVLFVLLVVFVGLPAFVFFKAPNRGVWNKRPKHPFQLPVPGKYMETMGQGESRLQEQLDLPPIGDNKQRGRGVK